MERYARVPPVAVLAALKAGGAYAPLDPTYPAERLRFMLEDTAAPMLLTQIRLLDRLPEHGARTICVDVEDGDDAGAEEDLPVLGTPDALAYVLFTSGSTGRPKGAAMPHRTLSNLLAWQRDRFSFAPAARTLQFASISFDVAFQELFSTWACGGTLVLIDEETRRDPDALLQALRGHSVERLFLPYIALQQLAEAAVERGTPPTSLREVITAGEALQITPAIRRLFSALPACTLHNQYGPTESHVVTAFPLPRSAETWPDRPPIGRPIANAQIHVLDERLHPVPVGVPGELYIGGDTLARGYLHRPHLTAERFVADPFRATPNTRLYRTGDRARHLADGSIEFLGRLDHQVKVRGFRVEPGEIEAELTKHAAVREALVLAREDEPGNRRLVAYVVADDSGSRELEGELRRFLGTTLPEYMVPSAVVLLDAFPLSPNGKVDRSALQAPDGTRSEAVFVAPRTPTEEVVARVWSEVLGVDPVGAEDDFFALGGHSLLATRVISRLRRAFGVEIGLRNMFEQPTVAGLAAVLDGLETEEQDRLPVLTPLDRRQYRLAHSPGPGAGT